MVSSNFSGFQEGNYYWNGAQVSYERYRYQATRQQEAVLKHVNDIMTSEATQAVAPGAAMDQQAFGGLLRSVVPTLLDKYGKVNATAALQFYDQIRTSWLAANGDQARQQASRGNVRLQADRYAQARTKSAVAAASGYVAQYADDYKTAERTDAVVNWAMKVRAKHGHQPAVDAMANAMTREVGAYHRDTVVFNAGLDPYVHKVQRVAQASACEFCRLMALGSTNGTVRTSNYAVHFHAHCHCTIQPLFEGEAPVRPDYYDKFEAEYAQVYKGNGAKDTLAEWRALSKKEHVNTEVATITKRVVNPNAPEQWAWNAGAKLSEQEYTRLFALAREIPLSEVRQELPLLPGPDTLENAVSVTNPKYLSKEPGYGTNCVRAAHAYELRRRGYDVVAGPKRRPNDSSQNPFLFEQAWKDADGKDLMDTSIGVRRNRNRGTLTDNTAQTVLSNYPEGSRGWAHFEWQGGGAGHIVNWEIQNGKVIFLDAQSGMTDGKVLDYFPRAKNIRLARLDDKSPQAYVLQYLEGFDQ